LAGFLFDNTDPDPNLICDNQHCIAEDWIGNQTTISFRQINLKNLHTLDLNTISYNGEEKKSIKDNLLVVNYSENKNKLKTFNQTFILKRKELQRVTYNSKKYQSTIITLDHGIKREIQPGIKLLQLETEQGKIKASIK